VAVVRFLFSIAERPGLSLAFMAVSQSKLHSMDCALSALFVITGIHA
jgi:hypothetical protein